MSHMTVLELMQCILGGLGVFGPLGFAMAAGVTIKNDEYELPLFMVLATLLQVVVMIAVYKAGGK